MANIGTLQNRTTEQARRIGDWDPFDYMRDLLQLSPFQDFPRRWLSGEAGLAFAPRFDIREDEECFVIQADMPGLKEADIDISLTGNRLCIRGQREEEQREESRSYAMRERSFGSFSRDFTLPQTIDAEHIEARMQDGVLEVQVPKRAESKPKKIPLVGHNGNGSSAEQPAKPAPREEGM